MIRYFLTVVLYWIHGEKELNKTQFIMEKNFNILYDQWDGERSIPNAKNLCLDSHGIKDPYYLILHYYDDTNLKSDRFKIKRCKIDEINNQENYYYII